MSQNQTNIPSSGKYSSVPTDDTIIQEKQNFTNEIEQFLPLLNSTNLNNKEKFINSAIIRTINSIFPDIPTKDFEITVGETADFSIYLQKLILKNEGKEIDNYEAIRIRIINFLNDRFSLLEKVGYNKEKFLSQINDFFSKLDSELEKTEVVSDICTGDYTNQEMTKIILFMQSLKQNPSHGKIALHS